MSFESALKPDSNTAKKKSLQPLHRSEAENTLDDEEHPVLHCEENHEEDDGRENDKVCRAHLGDLKSLDPTSGSFASAATALTCIIV
mmetsp:Transcript_15977/g.62184  ORF Transcript_15977/g.62184 Transcript_15977/m.62184 type:complete len:87 (+) Transcript_15977:1300-1560(+)